MFGETFKNFTINTESPSESSSVSSGDLITGHISFDLTKDTQITSITMALRGKARVHWSTGGGGGRRGRRHRRHYSAEVEFFHVKSMIVQDRKITGGTTKLRPGRHVYPFTCQLPQGDFPPSFRGVNGQIVYNLTVGINRPWRLSKDFVIELNFVGRIDTNKPELWAPLSGSNRMELCFLWCASGPITMTVSVQRKAYKPGETVKINCEFSNASSKTATPKAKLQQNQIFYTQGRVHKRMAVKHLASVTGDPVSAHTPCVNTELMLTIPSSASISISNCTILEVNYMIEVHLGVRAFADLTVLVPIILCDIPINSHPPSSL